MSDTMDCPRCGYRHKPTGDHDEDYGSRVCDECKYPFFVDIEYTAYYEASCIECKFGPWALSDQFLYEGRPREVRRCQHCGRFDLKPRLEST